MEHLLRLQGRRLQPQQLKLSVSPMPLNSTGLFWKLASYLCSKYTSVDGSVSIGQTLVSIYNGVMDTVERNYGRLLVKAAIGFITFSAAGVGDEEMEDLLSLDQEVLENVKQYCKSIDRIPSHVRLRLRGEFVSTLGIIVERNDCRLAWFHNALKGLAVSRYSDDERLHLHSIMAIYFGNSVSPDEVKLRNITPSPLYEWKESGLSPDCPSELVWFSYVRINNRRSEEAIFHMLAVESWDSVINDLCNVSNIVAIARSGGTYSVLAWLRLLSLKTNASNRRLEDYLLWMSIAASQISESPLQAVFATCAVLPLDNQARNDLTAMLQSPILARRLFDACDKEKLWFRCYAITGLSDWDASVAMWIAPFVDWRAPDTLCLAIHPTRGVVASGSSDWHIRIWESSTGQLLNVLKRCQSSITCLSFNSTGSHLVSAAGGSLTLHDGVHLLELGYRICSSNVNAMTFSPFDDCSLGWNGADLHC